MVLSSLRSENRDKAMRFTSYLCANCDHLRLICYRYAESAALCCFFGAFMYIGFRIKY